MICCHFHISKIHNKSFVDPSSGSCDSTTNAIPDCSSTDPAVPSSSNFVFSFSSCSTPSVTEIIFDPALQQNDRAITTTTEITVLGSGFASEPCANEVILGKGDQACTCTVLETPTPSESMFKCQPDSTCAQQIGELKELSVSVNNRGISLVKLKKHDRSVAFVLTITSILPSSGSREGGTEVTITGAGLGEFSSVMFTNSYAACEHIDESTIRCTSPKTVTGLVTIEKDGVPAVCQLTNGAKCIFKYDLSITPKVTAVTPSVVSSIDQITLILTGENLGNSAADVKVMIGQEQCSDVVIVTDDVKISCSLTGVPVGIHPIDMIIYNVGRAQTMKTVTGEAALNSVNPATGSVHGGTTLQLLGHGFLKGLTTVLIDVNPCEVEDEETTLWQIVCVTPSHSAGTVTITVTSNGIMFPELNFDYTDSATPTVNVDPGSPLEAIAGETITLQGLNFGSDFSKVTVTLDEVECIVLEEGFADDTLTCTLGSHSSGPVQGALYVEGKGFSNTFPFVYAMLIASFQPTTGIILLLFLSLCLSLFV